MILGSVVLSIFCGLGGREAVAASRTHTVIIDYTRFEPAELRVKVGDVIIWKNKDIVPHTVTSQSKIFDSGPLLSGKSWKLKVKKSGLFPYSCLYHPVMGGTLSVQ